MLKSLVIAKKMLRGCVFLPNLRNCFGSQALSGIGVPGALLKR
jgi:hypothetical protein